MSNNINELLPENWKEITFEDKIIFFNLKENLITFHPPFTLKNISLFFKLYEFKSTSEQFKKQLEDIVEKSNSNSTKKGKTEMTKEILNLDPIIDGKFFLI